MLATLHFIEEHAMETLWWDVIEADAGRFGVGVSERGLLAILLPNAADQRDQVLGRLAGQFQLGEQSDRLREACQQLREYFAGERREFDLELDLRGTSFQVDAWNAVAAVPYGETTSYGEIARRIGRPDAVRAVGAANGANPIPIVVPCHRIIGSNGKLTGYGGGLDLKRWLLKLEGIPVDGPSVQPALLP